MSGELTFRAATHETTVSIMQVLRMGCLRQVRLCALRISQSPAAHHPTPLGPISESDFFTWEALIMGPKDTPFEGGVFAAKLTFVSLSYLRISGILVAYGARRALSLQTTRFPLSR